MAVVWTLLGIALIALALRGARAHISLVNLTSLGYGDISPSAAALRILGPVETLFGLGLLTARRGSPTPTRLLLEGMLASLAGGPGA